jgi:tetratricopeptide (TPR) repeat protein
MDLLHFEGEPMYFDEPVNPEVERLLAHAAEHYGDSVAEHSLLRAYFLEPHHLSVLVALYRYFYYQRRYREALVTADRAIANAAIRLNLPVRWQDLSESHLGGAVLVSMTLTRFLLLALKGAGYLLLRLGEPLEALRRFDKIAEIDTSDRLGIKELRALAQRAVTEAEVSMLGGNLRCLGWR